MCGSPPPELRPHALALRRAAREAEGREPSAASSRPLRPRRAVPRADRWSARVQIESTRSRTLRAAIRQRIPSIG
jgi:hypothetical protein